MARRARLVASLDVERQLAGVKCPTLVVTGEAGLDRVVPVALTRDYQRIWPHAIQAVLEHTGHLGLITRAEEFARMVASFADQAAQGDRTAQNANRTSTWRSASGGMGAG
jgi:pimeloyl-ACP methyl ester carboxylesterase